MMEFHILLAGIEIGPLTERQVRAYLTDGLVSPSDPARANGMTEWEPVELLLSQIPQPVPVTPRLIIPESLLPEPQLPSEEILLPASPALRPQDAFADPEAKTESPSDEPPLPEEGPLAPEPPPAATETTPLPNSPVLEYTQRTAAAQKAKRAKSSKIVIQPMASLGADAAAPPDTGSAGQQETTSLPVFAIPPPRTKKPEPIKAIIARKQTPAEIPPPKKKTAPIVVATPPPLPPLPRPKKKRSNSTSFDFNQPVVLYGLGGLGLLLLLFIGTLFFDRPPSTSSSAGVLPTPTIPVVDPDEKILSSNPQTAIEFTQRGFARYNKGKFDLAAADYDQAIRLDPNYVLAYFRRGLNRQSKGNWDGALSDFNQTLKLDPRHADAFTSRAFVKQSQGDLDGATADYTQALMINPKIAIAYYNRGLIKEQRGNKDGALLDYNKALDLDDTMAYAYYHRGDVKNASGNLDGAIADYTHALTLNARIAPAFRNRGYARQSKNDLEGAVADYTDAIALDPKQAIAYYNRGFARQCLGDLDGAIADNTKVIELEPQNAAAYSNRGLALLGKAHLDEAAADLKMYCQLAPHEIDTDYARLYLWLIATEENPKGEASVDLANELLNDWNSPPADLPSKLAKFLIGRISENELFATITSTDPDQDSMLSCKALYFAGMKRLFLGDEATAVNYFRKAVATGRKDACEYIFAVNRLKAMGQSIRAPVTTPAADAPATDDSSGN